MRKIFAALAATTVGALFSTGAGAVVLGQAELSTCHGLTTCNVTGATLESSPNAMDGKTYGSTYGLGVSGGTGGEIDVGQSITVTFDLPSIVHAFSLAFIYNGPEFDDPNEHGTATVYWDAGGSDVFDFIVTDENVITFSGAGGWANCGDTTATGSGCFSLFGNPFGDSLIASIVFEAVDIPGFGDNSDYALSSLEFTPIPVPGALLLLLTGVAGLGFASRSRKDGAIRS